MFDMPSRQRSNPSILAFFGGLFAAIGIGLAAYASHGVSDAHLQSNLQSAALYAFGHGVALVCLAPRMTQSLERLGLVLIFLGTVLFSGSLAANALWGFTSKAAPIGGIGMMLGWLLVACNALRR